MTAFRLSAVLALSLLALAPPTQAQPIDVDELDALFESPPQVEVNLRGALLRMASQAASGESPAAAAMIDGLRSITVRIYPSSPDLRGLAVERFTSLGERFEADGWLTLVRVRSVPSLPEADQGDVWVYVREDGDIFDGMAVLAVDEEDENAVFVWIDGVIDPADVGELSRRYARVDVETDVDVYTDEDDDDDR